ncbi:MAG: hypothetical protein QXV69_10130, partial [Sulfolobaceae archaeon]
WSRRVLGCLRVRKLTSRTSTWEKHWTRYPHRLVRGASMWCLVALNSRKNSLAISSMLFL